MAYDDALALIGNLCEQRPRTVQQRPPRRAKLHAAAELALVVGNSERTVRGSFRDFLFRSGTFGALMFRFPRRAAARRDA